MSTFSISLRAMLVVSLTIMHVKGFSIFPIQVCTFIVKEKEGVFRVMLEGFPLINVAIQASQNSKLLNE